MSLSSNSRLSKTKTKTTTPKSMYSGSPVFEAAYIAFVQDVIDRDIRNVAFHESPIEKSIVIAGCSRYSVSKRTGLISKSDLTNFDPAAPAWKRCSLDQMKFWESTNSLHTMIERAWETRLRNVMPGAESCYDPMPKDAYPGRAQTYNSFIFLAARRRAGARAIRLAAVKTFVKLLWKSLVDPEVLKLCLDYFGHHATFAHYNFTVSHFEDLRNRAQETPNLVPIIGEYIRRCGSKGKKVSIPLDILNISRAAVFNDKLSPAGWRYLAKSPRSIVEAVARSAHNDYSEHAVPAALVVNLIADIGFEVPLLYVNWLLSNIHYFSMQAFSENRDSCLRFARLAGQQAVVSKKRKRLRHFIGSQIINAFDWFRYGGQDQYPYLPRAIPKNFTWAAIMRDQEAWHREMAERERLRVERDAKAAALRRAERDAMSWKCKFGRVIVDGTTVTPIVNGMDLRLEGETMTHCVADYLNNCVAGTSRIFHLHSKDEDATLELTMMTKRKWVVRQVHGKFNQDCSRQMSMIAKKVSVMYSQAP